MDEQTIEAVKEAGFHLADGVAGSAVELRRLQHFVELLGLELEKLVGAEEA